MKSSLFLDYLSLVNKNMIIYGHPENLKVMSSKGEGVSRYQVAPSVPSDNTNVAAR